MQSLYTRLLPCLAIYDCIYSGTNAKSDIDIIQPVFLWRASISQLGQQRYCRDAEIRIQAKKARNKLSGSVSMIKINVLCHLYGVYTLYM